MSMHADVEIDLKKLAETFFRRNPKLVAIQSPRNGRRPMTTSNAKNYYGWHLAERWRRYIAEGWRAWAEERQRMVEKWRTWVEKWQRVAEGWRPFVAKYMSTLTDQRRAEHRKKVRLINSKL